MKILIDIDDTITHLESNPYRQVPGIGCDYFRGVLRDILTDQKGYDPETALKMIQEKDPVFNGCIFFIAPTLGINESYFWDQIMIFQMKHLSYFPDAVKLVKSLSGLKKSLYIVSHYCPVNFQSISKSTL